MLLKNSIFLGPQKFPPLRYQGSCTYFGMVPSCKQRLTRESSDSAWKRKITPKNVTIVWAMGLFIKEAYHLIYYAFSYYSNNVGNYNHWWIKVTLSHFVLLFRNDLWVSIDFLQEKQEWVNSKKTVFWFKQERKYTFMITDIINLQLLYINFNIKNHYFISLASWFIKWTI